MTTSIHKWKIVQVDSTQLLSTLVCFFREFPHDGGKFPFFLDPQIKGCIYVFCLPGWVSTWNFPCFSARQLCQHTLMLSETGPPLSPDSSCQFFIRSSQSLKWEFVTHLFCSQIKGLNFSHLKTLPCAWVCVVKGEGGTIPRIQLVAFLGPVCVSTLHVVGYETRYWSCPLKPKLETIILWAGELEACWRNKCVGK